MESPSNTPKARERILIVEDDPSVARVLLTLLSPYGEVFMADGAHKAIELLCDREFDLILTDYEMPQGTGLDLLDFKNKQNIRTPVIMITAFGSKDLILESLKQRVFGFIEKPFTRPTVIDLVEKALQAYKEEEDTKNLATLGTKLGEVVHEINNPLSVLAMMVQWIKEEPDTKHVDKMEKYIQKIRHIISATKNELRGDERHWHMRFNLNLALNDALEQAKARAEAHGVSVVVVGNFDFEIVGDLHRVCQMIVNLVNNAIDAAAESKVTEKWAKVELVKEPGTIKILITDSGIGIPADIKTKLFQPHFSTKQDKGTGLGLVIVRKLAKEHRGNVYLNTSSSNTQFVLSLPLEEA